MDCELNDTLNTIFNSIENNKNFLLEAGAGAGKTYSLVETIKYIKHNYPKRKILCITYTNNAKNEIISRLNTTNNIYISTIHDFIWEFIKGFQKDLIDNLLPMIDEEREKIDNDILAAERLIANPRANTNIENKIIDLERLRIKKQKYSSIDLSKGIRYLQYKALYRGVLWHNDVLKMFMKFLENPAFCNLLLDSFSYIFIDEYQDTNKDIMIHLLNTINSYKNNKYMVFGLFGDSMQQIYNDGIGKINCEDNNLIQIPKLENYRSCAEIINLSNHFRSDGLNQEYKNLDAIKDKIMFIYNNSQDCYLKDYGDINISNYKRLFLNHRQIAEEVGFINIYNTISSQYKQNTGEVLKKMDDRYLKYINDYVMTAIYSYNYSDASIIINNINTPLFTLNDLNNKKQILDNLINDEDMEINNFVNQLSANSLLDIRVYNNMLNTYTITGDEEFLEELKTIKAKEYYNYYLQVNGKTMLETLHGVKGSEYNKIIINIEKVNAWRDYNFEKLLKNMELTDSIRERTHKILYVACTRPKYSLIINYIVNDGLNADEALSEANLMRDTIKSLFNEQFDFIIY